MDWPVDGLTFGCEHPRSPRNVPDAFVLGFGLARQLIITFRGGTLCDELGDGILNRLRLCKVLDDACDIRDPAHGELIAQARGCALPAWYPGKARQFVFDPVCAGLLALSREHIEGVGGNLCLRFDSDEDEGAIVERRLRSRTQGARSIISWQPNARPTVEARAPSQCAGLLRAMVRLLAEASPISAIVICSVDTPCAAIKACA